jgi:hypothetical protein
MGDFGPHLEETMEKKSTIHILVFNTSDFDEEWSYAFMGSHDLEKLELYKKQLEDESERIMAKVDAFKKDRDEIIKPLKSKLRLLFKEKSTKSPTYNHEEYKTIMKELTDLNMQYQKEHQKILYEGKFGVENLIFDSERQYLEIDELEMLD